MIRRTMVHLWNIRAFFSYCLLIIGTIRLIALEYILEEYCGLLRLEIDRLLEELEATNKQNFEYEKLLHFIYNWLLYRSWICSLVFHIIITEIIPYFHFRLIYKASIFISTYKLQMMNQHLLFTFNIYNKNY